MVIPDEVKQQILYHYPNAKFKISHGLFHSEELALLGKYQFFYGLFTSEPCILNILHIDGKIRSIQTENLNLRNPILCKNLVGMFLGKSYIGYLIEII